MANVIGNLRAILSLNTKSFVAGLTTAGRATKAFRGTMFDMGRGLRNFGGFLSGFVAPGAAIYTMVNQFRELGDLADLAERLNIDPKALQGFRLGAMDAGLAAEDTTTALQFMLKTVGEAAEGSKEANKALSGLGLSIKSLSAASSEEILYQIADALQKIPTASIRAAKEVDIFGRSGSKLDATLKGGREGLKGLTKEMAGMGRAFAKEELDKIDKAGDAFKRLTEATKGLFDQMLLFSSPTLEKALKALTVGVSDAGAVLSGESPKIGSVRVETPEERQRRMKRFTFLKSQKAAGRSMSPEEAAFLATELEIEADRNAYNQNPHNINPYKESSPDDKAKRLNRLRHLKRQGFKLDPEESEELKNSTGPVSMGGASRDYLAVGLLTDIRDTLKVIKERGGMAA